jgi:peroxin-12
LDYSDEGYAALMLLLELHSLKTTDASFSESLYGLRRTPATNDAALPQQSEAAAQSGPRPLTRKQRALSVLFLVGLPYLKYKLEATVNAERGTALQAALWGRGDADDADVVGDLEPIREVEPPSNGTVQLNIKQQLIRALVKCYPWVHAATEGASFAYQLLYLLDATRFYTPALHYMGLQVRRATGQELMDSAKVVEARRNHEFGRIRGPSYVQSFQRGLLRFAYTALDYAQTGLIASVFLFKMVEWWYQSAEERVSAPSVYPPPPPPPPPVVAKDGIQLPADGKMCPLCTRSRTNPAVVATSGFVFCYTCAFHYVTQYKRCPVTLAPTGTSQILRLYQDD